MQPTTYPDESSIILYLVVYVVNGYMWMQRFVFVFCQLWVELCKMWGDECIFMIISDMFINPPVREPHIWDPSYKSPVHLYMRAVLCLHKYYRRFSMLTSREFCRSFPASSVKKVNLHVEKPAGSDRQTQARSHLFSSAFWFYFLPNRDYF